VGVGQDHSVLVDVHDAGVGRLLEGDRMHVVVVGDAGADVEELADPGLVEVRESGIHGQDYVSGHAAVAFAVATVVATVVPRGWRWAPFAVASGVALTRVYYGAHLPLDVIGGAGLGVVCGVTASTAAGITRSRRP
jgi:membrane-associated phospholipid phosphatase